MFDNISYTYDENGIRASKTFDGKTTYFYVKGSQLFEQINGRDCGLHFFYDRNGELTAFARYYEDDEPIQDLYYYVKNAQGDITDITDNWGNIIASYTYDPWGKVLSVTGSDTVIGNLNPFRYRGYYYDDETGLYYLQSRYYDPEVGRLINCDDVNYIGISDTKLGYNALAYCENEPVNNSDVNGFWGEDVHNGYYNKKGKLPSFKYESKTYYYGTFYWMLECGLSKNDARYIAEKNQEIDKIYSPVKYYNDPSKQSHHFNIYEGVARKDSRLEWYELYIDKAIDSFEKSQNAFQKNQIDKGAKHKKDGLKYIGYALHSIQDYYAHTESRSFNTVKYIGKIFKKNWNGFWFHLPVYADKVSWHKKSIIEEVGPTTIITIVPFLVKYKNVFNRNIVY